MSKPLEELIEQKRRLFNRVFGAKYSLNLLELRGWINEDGRILKEVSFSFGEVMTALDIRVVCEELAKWLGGDLMGTVNLDFSGDEPSLKMAVETICANPCFHVRTQNPTKCWGFE